MSNWPNPPKNKGIAKKDPEREMESRLREFRVMRGLTIENLAKLADTSIAEVTELQNGLASPIYEQSSRAGKIRDHVNRICLVLRTTPSTLFPRYICDIERPDPVVDLLDHFGDYSKTMARWDPGDLLDRRTTIRRVRGILATMKPKQRDVLIERFGMDAQGGQSFQEMSDVLKVTRQCAHCRVRTALKNFRRFWIKGFGNGDK